MASRVLNRRYRLEQRTRISENEEQFLAFDALLQRPVTVVMPTRPAALSREELDGFRSKYQIASILHQRNIMTVLDLGEQDGAPYLVCEHFPGDTLRRIIDDEGPFDADDVAILIEQAAAGLQHAHRMGVVHLHLQPASIIVSEAGLAKIEGFGVLESQERETQLFDSDDALFAPPYAPDAETTGMPDTAIDSYALAAIAYEMLLGVKPGAVSNKNGIETGSARDILSPHEIDSRVPVLVSNLVTRTLVESSSGKRVSAISFSEALTNWRTPVEANLSAAPRRAAGSQASQKLASPQDQSAGTDGHFTSTRNAPQQRNEPANSRQSQKQSNPLRWFIMSSLLVAVAVLAIYVSVGGDPSTTASSIPTELNQLFEFAQR